MRGELTADQLRMLLSYDPETGIFRWRIYRGRTAKVGMVAGALDSSGHRQIMIGGMAYGAHRLAWLYMTGEWPEAQVDHRDTERDNNRWANLRAATRSQNAMNSRCTSRSKSGLKGAHYHSRSERWYSTIKVDGGIVFLGSFDTAEAAHAVYCAAAARAFGEFARAG